MTEVASRELRNDTAGLIRRAAAGERLIITVNGQPAAALVSLRTRQRGWVPGAEMARRLRMAQTDSGLNDDLAGLGDNTTDELGPLS